MKLVLFDVDGTLVDSQNIIVAAQRAAFQAHGLEPPSRERSLSIVGITLVQAMATLAGPNRVLKNSNRGPLARGNPQGIGAAVETGYKRLFAQERDRSFSTPC